MNKVSLLDTSDCLIKSLSLIADKHVLVKRIVLDINSWIRMVDVIDVNNITQLQAAELVKTKNPQSVNFNFLLFRHIGADTGLEYDDDLLDEFPASSSSNHWC